MAGNLEKHHRYELASPADPAIFDCKFQVPISKVRPFGISTLEESKLHQFPDYGPKVKPAVESENIVQNREPDMFASHETLHVPQSKVRPFVEDPYSDQSGNDLYTEHHRHTAKVQTLLETRPHETRIAQMTPGSSESLGIYISTSPNSDADHGSGSATSPGSRSLSGRNGLRLYPGPLSRHSISRCQEYPAYVQARPHSMTRCPRVHTPPGSLQTCTATAGAEDSQFARPEVDCKKSGGSARAQSVDDTSVSNNSQSRRSSGPQLSSRGTFETASLATIEGVTRAHASNTPLPPFIHSPIPISSFKPFFHDHSFSELGTRPTSSKASTSTNGSPSVSGQIYQRSDDVSHTREVTRNRPGESATLPSVASGRSHSLGSLVDYRRTTRWLREVLKYPESYTPKLTERPSKQRSRFRPAKSVRKKSESLLPSLMSSRCQTGHSTSLGSGARFDGLGFKRTVGDLERLLNEALAIASQVIDPPGTPTRSTTSSGLQARHHVDGSSDGSQANLTRASDEGKPDDMVEVDLNELGSPKRPDFKHAPTFSSLQRRPKLSEIIQGYSGHGIDIRPGRSVPKNSSGVARASNRKVSFQIPRRRSSRNMARLYAMSADTNTTDHSSRPARQKRPRYDGDASVTRNIVVQLAPGHTVQYGSAGGTYTAGARGQHSTHAATPGVGQGEESLPERDIAGRPMRPEHGISLRRKSHVSLRDASGFSLAKSRKRQATARD